MKRPYVVLPALLCALLLSGCGGIGAASPEPTPTPAPTPEPTPEPVSFTVTSEDGETMELLFETEALTLEDGSFAEAIAENASLLPALREISFPDGAEFTRYQVAALRSAFPEAEIRYNVILLGERVSPDVEELDLSAAVTADIPELKRELGKLEKLRYVQLTPEGSEKNPYEYDKESRQGPVMYGELTVEDVAELYAAVPDAVFDCRFLLFGQELSTADERVEYVKIHGIGDDGLDQFRRIIPAMGRLTYLKLDTCDTTSEGMAALRDEYPDIKVVWRIWFSNYGVCGDGTFDAYNCLTDTEKVWGTGICRDETTADLKYCTDVRYLDMGHNVMTNIDFISYMPKLEVCVLSITYVEDLSPFVNCPNLEFLELFRTYATDLTPLASCTNLEHLYVYDEHWEGLHDISPVMNLPKLKRFYCTLAEDAADQGEEFIRLHPDCETDFTWVFISLTKWRYVDGDYAERYALLREQIGYDTFDYSK